MFSKHTLAAKILKEAKDQGITLAVAKPIDDTEYKYGIDGMSLSNPDKGYEGATTTSPVVVPKLTGMSAEEYLIDVNSFERLLRRWRGMQKLQNGH